MFVYFILFTRSGKENACNDQLQLIQVAAKLLFLIQQQSLLLFLY